MADLSVKYAGMTFKNPLIAASGPTTDGVDMIKAAADAGFAGVVLKSPGAKGFREQSMMKSVPRYKIVNRLDYSQPWTPKLGLDNMGLIVQGESLSVWGDRYGEFIDQCKEAAGKDVLIGASGLCSSKDITSYDDAVEIANSSKADFIEIDLGYPRFYKDLNYAPELIKRLRAKTSLPLTVKIAPFLTDPIAVVKALYNAGADGICMFDIFLALDVDIETQAPLFKRTFPTVMMPEGMTLPYTLWALASTRMDGIDVGLSASFGVWVWKDVIKCILSGADTVQISRRVMVSGFEIATKWLRQINNWLDDKGFKSLRELKGKALDNIVDMPNVAKEVAMERGGVPSLLAVVDRDKCNGCTLCEKVCFYFAMKLDEDRIAFAEPSKCTACGLCIGTCAPEAITLEERAAVLQTR